MTKLVLQQGGTVIGEYPLLKPVVTIGRKPDNDLRIDNLAVSGHHARVTKDGDRFMIEDLGSTNGTFIGATRIKEHALSDGMEITVGKYTLRFVADDSRPEGEEQATVFIAPTKPAAARGRGTQRVVHAQPAHRETSGGGGRMVAIVLGGIAVAVVVFGLVLWLAGLL
jgi:pSer/pThr/pTyr-binding forkhead associated (FHA) protein